MSAATAFIDYTRIGNARWPRQAPYRFHKAGIRRHCKEQAHAACHHIWWFRIPIAWVRFTCLCLCHGGPGATVAAAAHRSVKVTLSKEARRKGIDNTRAGSVRVRQGPSTCTRP